METGQRLYSITELTRAFGVSASTLRYYEELGIISATERRARVRHYDRVTIQRLAFIRLWHGDGLLSLADTSAIMAGSGREQWTEVVAQHRAGLAATIGRLQTAQQVLEHLIECPRDSPLKCPVIEELTAAQVDAALATL
ncbi:MerR family transcriptional regulator [Mycolicibacterium goodii]|uniref:MerR family transcriptional regulator n=1 Tax=Mycolicibacterium goodii TaxID=134601 RepID=UPI001BDC59C5|nr:MerR family transcriptional regulator [Mycolicibacterium goodii]MBU8829753.1 MerR family transcriptional regulator [Mycolicibacterium goodii]